MEFIIIQDSMGRDQNFLMEEVNYSLSFHVGS